MLKKIILFLNYSSIDVCIGVLSLMLPLANLLAENPNVSWYIVVPLSVLLVYFVDHFLDLKLNPNKIISHRHQFIQNNLLSISIVSILIIIINTALSILFFNIKILICACILTTVIALYYFLISNYKKLFFKEILAAFIYSSGIILYPLCIEFEFNILHYGLLIFCIALINLIQNSLNEFNMDKKLQSKSLAIITGKKTSTSILLIIYGLLMFQLYFYDLNLQLKISFSILMLLHAFFYFVFLNKYYRVLTDLCFWIPGIIFLFFN